MTGVEGAYEELGRDGLKRSGACSRRTFVLS